MNISRIRVVVVCLILVHLLAALCCSVIAFVWMPYDAVGGVFVGTAFAQASLLAVWLALGRGPFSQRCLLVSLLLAASATLLILPVSILNHGELVIVLLYGGILLGQWLVVQIPLWLIRLVFGWRISTLNSGVEDSGRREFQFGIKQLLGWTAAVAILLGAGRWLIGDEVRETDTDATWSIAGFIFVLAGTNAMVAWPVIWAALARRWVLVWTIVAVVIVVVLTLKEPDLFRRVGHGGASSGFFWWSNGVHIVWVYGSLLVIRFCGYRVERRLDPTAPKGD